MEGSSFGCQESKRLVKIKKKTIWDPFFCFCQTMLVIYGSIMHYTQTVSDVNERLKIHYDELTCNYDIKVGTEIVYTVIKIWIKFV